MSLQILQFIIWTWLMKTDTKNDIFMLQHCCIYWGLWLLVLKNKHHMFGLKNCRNSSTSAFSKWTTEELSQYEIYINEYLVFRDVWTCVE